MISLAPSKLVDLYVHRQNYSLRWSSFYWEYRKLVFIGFLLFAAAFVFRSWPNLLHPGLYVEDSTHYFSHFYGGTRDLSALLHGPNGYVNILNNLIAMAVAKLDVRYQPGLYLLVAVLFTGITVMILPASGLFRNPYVLLVAPLVLGLSAMNHIFYYITLTYQIYVVIIMLLCLLFWEPCKNIPGNILLFLFLSLLVFSGPYCVLVVPFGVCFIVLFRGKTLLLSGLMGMVLIYLTTVEQKMIMLSNLFSTKVLHIWFNKTVELVFYLGLNGRINNSKILLLVVLFAAVLWLLRRDTFYLKMALLLMVLINSSMATLMLSKKFLLALRFLPCYLLLAQFFWIVLVLFTVDRLLALHQRLKHVGLLFAVTALLLVVYDNHRTPSKGQVPLRPGVPLFLETIYQAEQENLAEINTQRTIMLKQQGPHFVAQAVVGAVEGEGVRKEMVVIENDGLISERRIYKKQ